MIHQGMVDRLYFIVIHLGIYRVKRDQREGGGLPKGSILSPFSQLWSFPIIVHSAIQLIPEGDPDWRALLFSLLIRPWYSLYMTSPTLNPNPKRLNRYIPLANPSNLLLGSTHGNRPKLLSLRTHHFVQDRAPRLIHYASP